MALSNRELDEIAEDTYHNRRITGSIFCGRCGYNLRTLPHVYICPECGNRYNARPLKMKGIFFPRAVYPPFVDMALTGFFGVIAFLLLISALKPLDEGRLFIGVVFAVLTGLFAGRVAQKFQHFIKFRSLSKRIAEDENG